MAQRLRGRRGDVIVQRADGDPRGGERIDAGGGIGRVLDREIEERAVGELSGVVAAKGDGADVRDVAARLEAERELRRAKEAAEQARRLQQHFLANLSHEFKTPLTLIRGPLADLAGEKIPPASRPEAWRLVERNIARLDSLLTELIDLTRLEAGAFSLRVARRDLVVFVRRQLECFAPSAEAAGIALRLDAPTECPVFFDATKLEKVVGNLLGNALKFSPSRTTVRVSVNVGEGSEAGVEGRGAGEGFAEVRVRDQGPGMDSETRARVFERFFQGEAGLARGHEGMGIGMAIARELVELHGGSIRVASEPGAGSEFVFTLPLGCGHLDPDDIDVAGAPEPRPHAIGASRPAPDSGASGAATREEKIRPSLLLVEDNFDMRLYLRLHLDPHYAVTEATNGVEALAALERATPDIVLSDVMMPHMDGLEFCRRLRQAPRLRALPFVLLSAKALVDQRVEGLKAGADDYLAKPFSVSELLQRLAARLPRTAGPTPEAEAARWSGRLLACIDKHLGCPDFGVDALSRRLGYSSRQLRRRVLEWQGATTEAVILDRRLRRARQLIEDRRFETVAQVAHAVGLSAGYFSRRYRQVYGVGKIGL